MDDGERGTHVTLDYYKTSGKYYSDGETWIPYENGVAVPFFRCVEIVKAMLERGERPGLVDGFGFNTLVTVYTVYGPIRWMYIRGEDMPERETKQRKAAELISIPMSLARLLATEPEQFVSEQAAKDAQAVARASLRVLLELP